MVNPPVMPPTQTITPSSSPVRSIVVSMEWERFLTGGLSFDVCAGHAVPGEKPPGCAGPGRRRLPARVGTAPPSGDLTAAADKIQPQ